MKKIRVIILLILAIGIGVLLKNEEKNGKRITYSERILDIGKKSILDNDYIIFELNDKYGIMTTDEKIVKDSVYEEIQKLNENIYVLRTKDKLLVYNLSENLGFELDSISVIDDDRYIFRKDNKYGIIDSNLNVILEPENEKILARNGRILIINNGEKYILNGESNLEKISSKYEDILLGIGKSIYYKERNKFGIMYLDKDILQVNEPKYDNILELNDGNVLLGNIGNERYLINLNTQIEKKVEYEDFGSEIEGKIMVMKDGKIGYINEEGEEVIPPKYDGGFYFSKNRNFIQVKENGKWKLLNLETKLEKELPYDDIGEYEDGYMVVGKENMFGYIDENGKVKIPLEYIIAENFKTGIGVIAKETGYGAIDKKGRKILKEEYDNIFVYDNYIYVEKEQKIGLVDLKGREILPIEYDELGPVQKNKLLFEKNEKIGIIKLGEERSGN